MISIDGSEGEGGGQILRTALTLSLLTGEPFRIDRIRAGRRQPGLLRQHLTAVEAAQQVGKAKVDGGQMGSTRLMFVPGTVCPGDYSFRVGTAGSATLVMQTVLLPLLLAGGGSRLTLEGGTHNPFAPPFDFLVRSYLPLLNRMGPRVTAELDRPGFYPAGGGRFKVEITPADRLQPFSLQERGVFKAQRARVLLARLSEEIGQRQARLLREGLGEVETEVLRINNSAGPGNAVMAEVESEHVCAVFTGFGERGVPSEHVVRGVTVQVREYLAGTAPVEEHLADQLMLPMAVAGGGSYRATKVSLHARTNRGVIDRFLPGRIEILEANDGSAEFRFLPSGGCRG